MFYVLLLYFEYTRNKLHLSDIYTMETFTSDQLVISTTSYKTRFTESKKCELYGRENHPIFTYNYENLVPLMSTTVKVNLLLLLIV